MSSKLFQNKVAYKLLTYESNFYNQYLDSK